MRPRQQRLTVGDEIRYTAAFLRSTGQQAGEAGFRWGRVVALKRIGGALFASVDWADTVEVRAKHGKGPSMVAAANICRFDSPESYAR